MHIAVKILVLLSIIFSKTILAENISSPNNSLNLSKNILIYQGEQLVTSCEEIHKLSKQNDLWSGNTSNSLKTRIDQKEIWISFQINNNFGQEIVYFLPFFTGRYSELILCKQENGIWIDTASGEFIPNEKKNIDSNFPNFQLLLPRHSTKTYFLKLLSKSQINTSLTIYPLNTFLNLSNTHNNLNLFLSIFYITLIILLTIRFLEKRKISTALLILYCIVVLFYGLHELNFFSILNIFHSNAYELPTSIFFLLIINLLLGYSSYYFEDEDYPSKLPNYLRMLIGLILFIYAISQWGIIPIPNVQILCYSIISVYFILIFTSYSFIKQDYPPADLYFYSLVIILFPGFLYMLYALQFLPSGFPSYLLVFAIPFHIILIAYPVLIHKVKIQESKSEILSLDPIDRNINVIQKPIYKKSHILGINIENKINELKKLMEVDKVFLDEELHSGDLAAILSLTPHQLSQLMSQVLGTHYHKMIQEYRIREAIEKIKQNQSKNLLTIGFEVGFQSKSAFNTAFKKVTGKTPMEVKKSFQNK